MPANPAAPLDVSEQVSPRFEHDCPNDVFLGRYEQFDLYVADHGGGGRPGVEGTYIARWSHDGPDYKSGAVFVGSDDALTAAHVLAQAMGVALFDD